MKDAIRTLQKRMIEENIGAYIVATADYHQSEYISDYFKTREYLSGFTGSAGTLIVGQNEAALYTDGRYFIQAEKELFGSGIKLMKTGEEGVPDMWDYLAELMSDDVYLGFDSKCIDAEFGLKAEAVYAIKEIDLVKDIWCERPKLPFSRAYILEEKYAGESIESKLSKIRATMKENNAKYHMISSLCDICWLYNIRGNDIECNPVVLSYTLISMDAAVLYADFNKFDENVVKYLKEAGVRLCEYDRIYEDLSDIEDAVMADVNYINYNLYKRIKTFVKVHNPSLLLKSVKNETEIKNLREAHLRDGIALTKFIYWVKKAVEQGIVTEKEATAYLEERRKECMSYVQPSFDTICAYGANGALMHYSGKERVELKADSYLLVDSGGQYYEGTTDVTRTISLGNVSDYMKECYTLVLKGMINLSKAVFLHGCTGRNLDILARGPLWEKGLDYKCGTGHGIGYMLNVHEGPNGFRWKQPKDNFYDCVIEEGMVSSNEPGLYFENEFGIRLENEILAKKHMKNEYGQFMKFETLTLAPFDNESVEFEMLSDKEKEWLKLYHEKVYEIIGPHLLEDEKKWLKDVTEVFANG